jgi:hypothetical protein
MLSKIYGIRPWQYRFSIEWDRGTALIATERDLAPQFIDAMKQEITSGTK